MVASVVSVNELRDYMSGINLTSYQEESAQEILDGVQSGLEKFIHRPIGARHIREGGRTDARGIFNVRVSPIHRVLSIRTSNYMPDMITSLTSGKIELPGSMTEVNDGDGNPIEQIDYVKTPTVDGVRTYGSPEIIPGGIVIGSSDTNVVVEYVAGYIGDLLPDIRLSIMRVAAREMERMHDDTRSLLANSNEPGTDSQDIPKGWTEDELQKFNRIRRRVIRSL